MECILSTDMYISDLIAKVDTKISDKGFKYIISEYARPINNDEFLNITGVNYDTFFHYLVCYKYNDKNNKTIKNIEEKISNSEFLSGIVKMYIDYDLFADDFTLENLGIIDDRIVLLDYGMDNENFGKYYGEDTTEDK